MTVNMLHSVQAGQMTSSGSLLSNLLIRCATRGGIAIDPATASPVVMAVSLVRERGVILGTVARAVKADAETCCPGRALIARADAHALSDVRVGSGREMRLDMAVHRQADRTQADHPSPSAGRGERTAQMSKSFSREQFDRIKAAAESYGYTVVSTWRPGLKNMRLGDIVLSESADILPAECACCANNECECEGKRLVQD